MKHPKSIACLFSLTQLLAIGTVFIPTVSNAGVKPVGAGTTVPYLPSCKNFRDLEKIQLVENLGRSLEGRVKRANTSADGFLTKCREINKGTRQSTDMNSDMAHQASLLTAEMALVKKEYPEFTTLARQLTGAANPLSKGKRSTDSGVLKIVGADEACINQLAGKYSAIEIKYAELFRREKEINGCRASEEKAEENFLDSLGRGSDEG